MVTKESIEEQLRDINYNYQGWGRTEICELPGVIMPDEKIFECVNGIYEGGFALLVATNFRLLLIDKKPLNYLTVEDLRFDMISEIDYSHRLLGARIDISTGLKNLRFLSFNQPRLRKLINHVQDAMAEAKKKQSEHEEGQKSHLEQINQQLQAYLLAQHQQQQNIQQQIESNDRPQVNAEPIRPTSELADYLYAQSLLAQHQAQHNNDQGQSGPVAMGAVASQNPDNGTAADTVTPVAATPGAAAVSVAPQMTSADLYQEGVNEVFGKRTQTPAQAESAVRPSDGGAAVSSSPPSSPPSLSSQQAQALSPLHMAARAAQHVLEVNPNPIKIAHAKLPLAMRNKKFGRPSFHAHSQADTVQEEDMPPTAPSKIATVHS